MQATVDGVRWRLHFEHTPPALRKSKGNVKAVTLCSIEQYEMIGEGETRMEGWRVLGANTTSCGRKDRFTKEQGRQFAMIRTLRAVDLPKPVKAKLIEAYIKSGNRFMCHDLWAKGFDSLYDCVFRTGVKV